MAAMLLRSVGPAPAFAEGAFRSFIARAVPAWWRTVFTSHSGRWSSHQRRRSMDFLNERYIWSATGVGGFSPPCRRSPPWGSRNSQDLREAIARIPEGSSVSGQFPLVLSASLAARVLLFHMKVGVQPAQAGAALKARGAHRWQPRGPCTQHSQGGGVCRPRAILLDGISLRMQQEPVDPEPQARTSARCATS